MNISEHKYSDFKGAKVHENQSVHINFTIVTTDFSISWTNTVKLRYLEQDGTI